MKDGAAVETYDVGERFERTMKLFRGALADVELEVAAEFDGASARRNGGRHGNAERTLLVDSPLLNLEALALDRAAALFLPVHVILSARGEHTRISILDLARAFHARLPAGAAEPIQRLVARIRMAVESVTRSVGSPEEGLTPREQGE